MRYAAGLVLWSIVPWAGTVGAQQAPPNAVSCSNGKSLVADSTLLFIGLTAPSFGRGKPVVTAERSTVAAYVKAVAQAFDKPSAITFPQPQGLWRGGGAPDSLFDTPSTYAPLSGTLRMLWSGTHQLRDVAMSRPTESAELNRALIGAAWLADTLTAYAELGPFRSAVNDTIEVDVVALENLTTSMVPLLRARASYYAVEKPVTLASMAKAQYPAIAQKAQIESAVDLRYWVGADGALEPESIRVVQADFVEFATSALTSVQNSRFKPAMAKGCGVRMVVQERVRFVLGAPGR